MPTERCGWVRRSLRDGRAKVVKRSPFTIQLTYVTTDVTQPVTLGVDTGSKHIGLSATTEKQELFAAEVTQRNDVKKNIESRRDCRRTRRSRKTRYRKPRFNNRKKRKGKIPPSLQQKAETHLSAIKLVTNILPVTTITVEIGQFDPHKLKDPTVTGKNYQNGPCKDFENTKAYIRYRDNYTCKVCGSKDHIEVHHKQFRSHGGSDTPDNLVCLCHDCHKKLHGNKLSQRQLNKLGKPPKTLRDTTFMNLIKPYVVKQLYQLYPNTTINVTYGYITTFDRHAHNIDKSHINDAFCIAGNFTAQRTSNKYYMQKIRCHNRQLYKMNFIKGHVRKNNQCPHAICNFHRFDKVKFNGKEYFIWSLRSSGSFMLKNILTNDTTHRSYKKLQHLENTKNFLIQPL